MPSFVFSAAPIFLFFTTAFCCWLAAYGFAQPRSVFSRNFVALMLAAAVYALGYGVELASPDLAAMQAALRLQYLGIPFLPLAWIGLAWSYLDPRGLPRGYWRGLFALSAFICLAHQTNALHHLYYAALDFSRDGRLSVARITPGPLYWLNIVYLNVGVGAGVVLFFRAWRQSRPIYHRQALCLLVGSSFPWLFHLIYQLGLSPHGIDLSPFGLTAGGLLFAVASFRHGVLDVLPMARDLVFDGIAEGVIVVDEHARIVDYNRAAKGYFPELAGHALDLHARSLDAASPLARVIGTREPFELPMVNDGQTRHLEVRCYPMAERGGRTVATALLVRDVSEKRELIEQLHRAASIDELTGVFNRRHLMDESQRAFRLARRHGQPLAVILIDVDYFKEVNDRRGHLAGDALLTRIASLLRSRLRTTDILGRYGGDEFIITLPETDAARAAELARQLAAHCVATCETTLSLGVAQAQSAMRDFTDLLGRADEALYRAKANGRNQVAIASPTAAQ